MSKVEIPRLNNKQRERLKYWEDSNRLSGSWKSDLTIVIDDLDPEVKNNGGVVCAADIINSLIATESNSWYGNVLLAAAVYGRATVGEIVNFQAAEGAKIGEGTQEEIRERIGRDRMESAAELMRRFGLLTRIESENPEYELSRAAMNYWSHFEESYKLWRKKDPPTPAFRLTPQK